MTLTENDKSSRARKRGPVALTEMNDRHRQIIALLTFGIDGKRLTTGQVAEQLRMRPGYVHSLLSEPVFAMEYARALEARKLALKPKALDRLDDLIDSESESVALSAVKVALDEPGKGGVNVTVNNQVNTDVKVTPGYVIRLPATTAPTIEHEP